MPLDAPRWPFNETLARLAPLTPGVFVLWIDDALVYIGSTGGRNGTLRDGLLQHCDNMGKRRPTHFAWEITWTPTPREAALLAEHRALHDRLPAWNLSRAERHRARRHRRGARAG